jgi:hypothetical protein
LEDHENNASHFTLNPRRVILSEAKDLFFVLAAMSLRAQKKAGPSLRSG